MYISTGASHTMLVSDDYQHIWAFGNNTHGQLGHGDILYRDVPTEIQRREDGLPEGVKIVAISCGNYHTVLLSDDGRIWTFGDNEFGQLGHGDTINRNMPTEIKRRESGKTGKSKKSGKSGKSGKSEKSEKSEKTGLPKDVRIVGVICGGFHTLLLSDKGRIWTFGNNYKGQLGHGDNGDDTHRNIPTEIQRGVDRLPKDIKIVNASCGDFHTVLLSDDGLHILSFGDNLYGQLGIGYIRRINVPTKIQRTVDGLHKDVRIVSISCRGYHTVLISDTGRVWAFGINVHGQLGLEALGKIIIPTEIKIGENELPEDVKKDVKIAGVSCGGLHTVLLSDDGRHIWTFGSNSHGQLGQGDSGIDIYRNIPTEIHRREPREPRASGLPKDVKIIGVSCGSEHTVLLSDDGRIWTFGINTNGQLGHGDNQDRQVPIMIENFSLRHF